MEIGHKPDNFTLLDDLGQPVEWISFRSAPVVVFCYPKADTPGCTKEACAFRDLGAEFARHGVTVLGLSADKSPAQAKFREKYALTARLLCDPDKIVLAPWGVWAEKKMYGRTSMGIVRSTFLFDADGALVADWKKVKVDGHAEKVLQRVVEKWGVTP